MTGSSKSRHLIGIMFRPACKILILIGLATLLLSIVTIWQYQASTRRTRQINARVISINKITGIGKDEHGHDNQACRVDYRFKVKGDEYTAVLGYRGEPTTDKCRLHKGQLIEVKYDPSRPANNAYLPDHRDSGKKTLLQTIFAAGSIALVGIVPIVIGVIGLKLAKSRRTQSLLDRLSPNRSSHDEPGRSATDAHTTTARVGNINGKSDKPAESDTPLTSDAESVSRTESTKPVLAKAKKVAKKSRAKKATGKTTTSKHGRQGSSS